jgi:hypothetical protein
MKKVTTTAPAWSTVQLSAITAAAERTESGLLTNEDVTALAKTEPFVNAGKTLNMVRSKAVNMDVYQKATTKSVGVSGTVTRKIEFVNAIEILASLNKGSLASLEKASKPQLEALANALTSKSDKQAADSSKA